MRVCILGCGYVGLALGRRLQGKHEVVGVRRSTDGLAAVGDVGLEPHGADLTDEVAVEGLPAADWIVFAASAGGRDPKSARETYVDAQRTVLEEFATRANPPDRYVYTSSTGVYGDQNGEWVDEETPLAEEAVTSRTEALRTAERVALEETGAAGIDGTVARLAGLYGPERYRLSRYLEGPVTEGILNLVHRDDAAGAIEHLLRTDVARGETVLVVDTEPVQKGALAAWLASECGEPMPETVTVDERIATGGLSERMAARIRAQKRCQNAKLRGLGYDFDYPTFREGYRAAIAAYNASET